MKLINPFDRLKFQSTHPRGVRHVRQTLLLILEYFNPRTHVGCDSNEQVASIPYSHFNPRTHVGCDGQLAKGVGR